MSSTPILHFPKAYGQYVGADGTERAFVADIMGHPPHPSLGREGYVRSLRDRLPDNSPGEPRRYVIV